MSETREQQTVGVFAPLYPPAFRGGGPVRSIAALVSRAPEEMTACIVCSDRDLGMKEPLPVTPNTWLEVGRHSVRYVSTHSVRHYARALMMLHRHSPSIIHLNSFMNPLFSIVPVMLARVGFWGGATILLSPRGEFGSAALGRRALKKRIYMGVFRLLRLKNKVVWHSTAPHETEEIRGVWGPAVRIVERANDTQLPPEAATPTTLPGAVRCVFLGRLVPHKGLDIVLNALSSVADPVQLDIYGSEEDVPFVERCRALADALPERHSVRFRGALPAERVLETLREQDVLLMPTAGENFGHVIAEALAASNFVVTTPHTPWNDILREGGGLVVPREVEAWGHAITHIARDGQEARLDRRKTASDAYARWLSKPTEPHVWSLARATDVLRPRE